MQCCKARDGPMCLARNELDSRLDHSGADDVVHVGIAYGMGLGVTLTSTGKDGLKKGSKRESLTMRPRRHAEEFGGNGQDTAAQGPS